MGLTKNLGWLSKYITAAPNGNISLGSDSGLGFQLLSETDNTRGLYMGYNYSGNYAQIEAVHQNVGYKNIILNPNGGNIGIGVNPTYNFDVYGGSSSAYLRVGRDTGYAMLGAGLGFSAVYSRDNLNAPRNFIIDAANVGIGTESPNFAKLSVSSGNFGGLRIDTDAGNAALTIGGTGSLSVDAFGISGGRFSVRDNGNVLIGTTTDSGFKLNVNGSSSVSGAARASNFSPYNFAGVTAGSPSSATIPLGYSSMSIASLCDGQWRVLLNNLNDVKAFCWVTMGDASSKDTASYQMGFTNPSYGVNSMSAISYSDNGWNTGSFALTWDGGGGNIRLLINTTSYYSSSNYAYGTIHFLRLE
jgi:hypothetical protein